MKQQIYIATPVCEELPPFAQIVVVLLDGRLPMMSQLRPSENGQEWWTLGMGLASRIEQNKKCVTHWLKPVIVNTFTDDELQERDRRIAGEAFEAGVSRNHADEFGGVPNRYPNKTDYINSITVTR